MKYLTNDPKALFHDLGGLHDADIESINWDLRSREFSFDVDDLFSSFEGLPEYAGKKQASVVFSGVKELVMECESGVGEATRIYKLEIDKMEGVDAYSASIKMTPEGAIKFNFLAVNVIEKGSS